jgi:hypothetical protein
MILRANLWRRVRVYLHARNFRLLGGSSYFVVGSGLGPGFCASWVSWVWGAAWVPDRETDAGSLLGQRAAPVVSGGDGFFAVACFELLEFP